MSEPTQFDEYDKVPGYGDASLLRVIASIDESEIYEVDETRIAYADGRYALVTASGCSCWDGDWEIEWFDGLAELEASARSSGDRRYNPSGRALDELLAALREGRTP